MYKNNLAFGIVATPPDPAVSGTSITMTESDSILDSQVPFQATLHPANQIPTKSNSEIITVTDITGEVMTIVRAQNGTSAKTPIAGWMVSASVYAEDFKSKIAYVIAANDAPDDWKGTANVVCDGTADNVQIQAAIDSVLADGGGTILLSPGNFAIAATLNIVGTHAYTGPQINILGQGQEVTRLVGGNNIDIFALEDSAKVQIENMTWEVSGSGDGMTSTGNSTSLLRGFHWSTFRNIYITGEGNSHTGWGMNLGNPFRSVFENIDMFDVDNGIHIISEDASFNPGDCTFNRVFIELNSNSGGVGVHLESPTGLGQVNQIIFDMLEMIDGGSAGTGILINGAAGPSHNIFRGVNIEDFATATINCATGYGNRFNLNHVTTPTGSSFVIFGSDANGNEVERVGFLAIGSGTVTVINDANGWTENPNVLQDVYLAVDSGGTANATVDDSTVIRKIHGYNDGTASPHLAFGERDMGVVVHGATAGTTRPNGYAVVTWIGSVEPTNAADDDIWYDIS